MTPIMIQEAATARSQMTFPRGFQGVGGLHFLSASSWQTDSACLTSWGHPPRPVQNEHSSHSLCLIAKRIPWANVFGLERRPQTVWKQLNLSQKYLFVLFGFWRQVGSPAGGCEVWQLIWVSWLKREDQFRKELPCLAPLWVFHPCL